MILASKWRRSRQIRPTKSSVLGQKYVPLLTVALVAFPIGVRGLALAVAASQRASAQNDVCAQRLWVGAYIPGWNQDRLDPNHDPALGGINHFLQFAVLFHPGDGRLDLRTNELTTSKMKVMVKAAHKAGRQVLLVVGGEGAAPGLRFAASQRLKQRTAESLIALVDRYGYDGIDVDWEPLTPGDADLYRGLVEGLRKGLDETVRGHRKERLVLTTAIEVELNDSDYMTSLVKTLAQLSETFDRINLMTYAMANPGNLPFVWHNAALYPGSDPTKQGTQTPSADGAVRALLSAGIKPSKLGIGINLHGYLWTGQNSEDVSIPGKSWKVPPTFVELTYGEVMKKYFDATQYRWDEEAEVPYLSNPRTNQFLSYEDSRGIEAKVHYVQQKRLGGIIIWDIGRDDRDQNDKYRLLRVIEKAANECAVP